MKVGNTTIIAHDDPAPNGGDKFKHQAVELVDCDRGAFSCGWRHGGSCSTYCKLGLGNSIPALSIAYVFFPPVWNGLLGSSNNRTSTRPITETVRVVANLRYPVVK
jgi:hypothetical protein